MTEAQRETSKINEHLADIFYRGGQYTPAFLFVSGLGVLAIYWLNQKGFLGDLAPRLAYISGAIFFLALAQWLISTRLAARQKGIAAYIWSAIAIAIFAMIVTIFWQGFIFLAIPIVFILPVAGFLNGLPRRYIPGLVVLVLLSISGIWIVNSMASRAVDFDRLQFNSTVAIASLTFVGATSLLLITITIISQNRNFRSLQGLLLTSFVIIVTIPTVMTTVLSGVGTYSNSQAQTFSTLKAISNLKEDQIALLIDDIRNDAEKIQGDSRFKKNILPMLTPGDTGPDQLNLDRALARSFIISIQQDKGKYAEIMILDTRANVVVSTDVSHTDINYESQLFYRQGTLKFFTGFSSLPEFGDQNFIVATPLFDTNGQTIRGVIVLRSDAGSIKRIMESTPGYVEAETYLVDKDFSPVTKTRITTSSVRTKASLDSILNNAAGQATYQNYAGDDVLGYYRWYEPMQMAIIAELPVRVVVKTSLVSLAGSSLLALLVIGIAIAAVAIAARSISDPIIELAQVTESYGAGKFHVRAHVNRKDEIGALASSYNQMAAELQDIIGKLEQRVSDRTKELEDQTLRVRVAAEIARDAASSRDLSELLESTAKLLLERFHFYHAGIFLVDKTREFVVLTASPTDAGKMMIENGYRIHMGELGVIGRVASSGEPRILLDTGTDVIYSKNPLLPNTRSEMALPLKVGNLVIGVLDVHSEQSQAFSQDDIAILQVMADQLATAIERTRLLQEVEYNLKELEKAYGQYTREGWQKLSGSGQLINRGYRFDNVRIEPINQAPVMEETAGLTGDNSNGQRSRKAVSIPIKLRGQTIGVINAKLKEGSPRTISTLEAVADRLAAALESARLYEDARSRADREQTIAQVTTKISSSNEFEAILRTTVEEIGKSLGNSEVSIQIVGDLDKQDFNS